MSTITIKNGRLIDPKQGIDQITDIQIQNQRVTHIGPDAPSAQGPCFDAEGCLVTPGLIDPHVHLREPGQEDKETIATGAASAINGGFTTICCMPNTSPALDDETGIEFVYTQAEKAQQCNVYPVGAITKNRDGQQLAEMGLMAKSGAVAFSDDGIAVASAGVMAKALKYAASVNRPIMQHCEEAALTGSAVMNSGLTALKLGLTGWPSVAEELTLQRDIMLNADIGCRYHAQHVTTRGGIELIRQARKHSKLISGEVSPHHLLLTDEACDNYNTNAKMNPPLRTDADVAALREGVRDGTITILATDHAPHTEQEKSLDFNQAPFGIVGLDCALALYIKALITPGVIDWPQMIAMLTINPAELCQLDQTEGKGHLSVGASGDVTIIDPNEQWTIDVNDFKSKSRNCPFDQWAVQGRAIATIVGGDVKMNRSDDRLKQA